MEALHREGMDAEEQGSVVRGGGEGKGEKRELGSPMRLVAREVVKGEEGGTQRGSDFSRGGNWVV